MHEGPLRTAKRITSSCVDREGRFASRTGIIDRMSITISALARCAVPVVVALAGSTAPAAAEGGTVVPMRSILRACDFSPIPDRSSTDRGTASAVIHVNGGSVTADVHLAESGQPGTHYDVSLIQVPRASNAPCDVPGPGVAVAGLDSDGAGVANDHRAGRPSLRHDRGLGVHPTAERNFAEPGRVLHVRLPREGLNRRQAVLAVRTPSNLLIAQEVQRLTQ